MGNLNWLSDLVLLVSGDNTTAMLNGIPVHKEFAAEKFPKP